MIQVKVIVAYDIGGTNMRIEVRDLYGNVLCRRSVPTYGDDYGKSLFSLMFNTREMTQGHHVVAAGAGVAGAIKNGVITGSGNLKNWIGENFQTDLGTAVGAPATVINDCAAAALGEYAVFQRPLIYVIWGTGVGVAVVTVVNGEIVVRSTELGHMIIDRRSKLMCGCGGRGHLEAHVGGGNLSKRFSGMLAKLFGARKVEKLTDKHWSKVLSDMAAGLRTLSEGDMDLSIVLGGGVSEKQLSERGSHRLPELQQLTNNLAAPASPPKLLLAQRGEDSGIDGAALAARQLFAA